MRKIRQVAISIVIENLTVFLLAFFVDVFNCLLGIILAYLFP